MDPIEKLWGLWYHFCIVMELSVRRSRNEFAAHITGKKDEYEKGNFFIPGTGYANWHDTDASICHRMNSGN